MKPSVAQKSTQGLMEAMPRYQAVKVASNMYRIDDDVDDVTLEDLPDLDIFQATLICDALNRDDSTSGDKLVEMIDRFYDAR